MHFLRLLSIQQHYAENFELSHEFLQLDYKNVEDIQELDNNLKKITGIVDTSIFVGKVNFVLSIDDDGYIRKF